MKSGLRFSLIGDFAGLGDDAADACSRKNEAYSWDGLFFVLFESLRVQYAADRFSQALISKASANPCLIASLSEFQRWRMVSRPASICSVGSQVFLVKVSASTESQDIDSHVLFFRVILPLDQILYPVASMWSLGSNAVYCVGLLARLSLCFR